MSRHKDFVLVEAAAEVFNLTVPDEVKELIDAGGAPTVTVYHGYDHPLNAYFCDLGSFPGMKDKDLEDKGIYYGVWFIGTRYNKGDYFDAMNKLGLKYVANYIAMDLQY